MMKRRGKELLFCPSEMVEGEWWLIEERNERVEVEQKAMMMST